MKKAVALDSFFLLCNYLDVNFYSKCCFELRDIMFVKLDSNCICKNIFDKNNNALIMYQQIVYTAPVMSGNFASKAT